MAKEERHDLDSAEEEDEQHQVDLEVDTVLFRTLLQQKSKPGDSVERSHAALALLLQT